MSAGRRAIVGRDALGTELDDVEVGGGLVGRRFRIRGRCGRGFRWCHGFGFRFRFRFRFRSRNRFRFRSRNRFRFRFRSRNRFRYRFRFRSRYRFRFRNRFRFRFRFFRDRCRFRCRDRFGFRGRVRLGNRFGRGFGFRCSPRPAPSLALPPLSRIPSLPLPPLRVHTPVGDSVRQIVDDLLRFRGLCRGGFGRCPAVVLAVAVGHGPRPLNGESARSLRLASMSAPNTAVANRAA